MSLTTITRILQLAAFTLLPLAGVLWLGWDWREVLLLYWLENISVGLATVVRIIRAQPSAAALASDPSKLEVNGKPVAWQPGSRAAKLGMAGFFCLHYGLFTLVHGVFVFVFIAGGFGFGAPTDSRPIEWLPILVIWVVGTLVQVAAQVLGPPATDSIGRLFMAPYGRIIVLHITIIGGAFLMSALQWPPIAAVLLIVLHGVIDVGRWGVRSLRTAPAEPQQTPTTIER